MNCSNAGRRSTAGSRRCGGIFDTSELEREIAEIDGKLSDENVWANPAQAAELNRRRAELVAARDRGAALRRAVEDAETLLELDAEGEAGLDDDFAAALADAERRVEALEVATMLSDEEDHLNAYISIHPGAGGIDAQD